VLPKQVESMIEDRQRVVTQAKGWAGDAEGNAEARSAAQPPYIREAKAALAAEMVQSTARAMPITDRLSIVGREKQFTTQGKLL
jgi:hypothetical protein